MKIIELKYPEFKIDLEQDPYIFKSVGSSVAARKKIDGIFGQFFV